MKIRDSDEIKQNGIVAILNYRLWNSMNPMLVFDNDRKIF